MDKSLNGGSTGLQDSSSFNYEYASAPDIIRAHQKDAYFQGVLLDHISTILRQIKGSRFVQTHQLETGAAANTLYFCLSTLVGNRTLGEEYCDVVQVEEGTLQLPCVGRRAGFIASSVFVPYVLTLLLPALRRRLRLKLERSQNPAQKEDGHSRSHVAREYILQHLDTLTSTAPFDGLTLAAFYFSGSYYHLSKRLFGLRYIFTRRLEPSEARLGYEVLGVLLGLQFVVQMWLHLRKAVQEASASTSHALSTDGQTSRQSQKLRPTIEQLTQTPRSTEPAYGLQSTTVMQWIGGFQQRKCTLCLEEMKDPSITTCGHIFCWACISDWCREKPECPLCRQSSLPQHILPLRT